MKFTVKIRHIDQTRAAQINHAIESPREGGLRGALARADGGCSAGAAARAGRRMARCAFLGFWTLGGRKIDRMASPAAGLTGPGGRQGEAGGGSAARSSAELTG